MSDSSLEILVPNLPESVTDATVAVWNKKIGDIIQQGEILLELETDKIMLEVPASESGILDIILEKEGSIVSSGQILGRLKTKNFIEKADLHQIMQNQKHNKSNIKNNTTIDPIILKDNKNTLSPAIRKLIVEHNINIKNITGSGIKGRITRQDVEIYIQKQSLEKNLISESNKDTNIYDKDLNYIDISTKINHRKDTRITMNRLRKKVAERLLAVTNSTAMLTTFNEVNMKPIMMLKNKYKELFEKRHGIKLGFMSFYVKAVLEGLRLFPEINASIDGDDIVYHTYFDISIAVSTKRGLVTPILKNVDTLNIYDIEKNIKSLAEKGRNGKLTIEDLNGGTFTITNGGIFGSLMSTPIINPPQSAILGMHTIKERPMVVDNEIIILPMMYLALSYDHRLIDGKDAVGFLTLIKELIEDPIRLLLSI